MAREFGDLEAAGAFEAALAARSARREVILALSDGNNLHWAHNLVLNLAALGLHNHLLIASSAAVCSDFAARSALCGCGHSSYLRRGSSAAVTRGLERWGIAADSPYHLWWQRWRYLGRAVALGYGVLSVDTDVSFRHDPYALLHGALGHRQLVVSLESDRPARVNRFIFPAANAGFVYCRGAADGAAQWVLAEVARRAEAWLVGDPITHNRSGDIVQRCLWDQDHFKDAMESAAFGVTSYRHVLYYADRSPAALQPLARKWDWEREVRALMPGLAPRTLAWLPLRRPGGGGNESVGGVPLSMVGAYMICTSSFAGDGNGNECDGAWGASPSPVLVGHMVFAEYKYAYMRGLGWWHHEASRTAGTVFHPPTFRALAIRRHALRLPRGGVAATTSAMVRWLLVAVAAGRRLVLPYVPCELHSGEAGGAPPVPAALRRDVALLPLRDQALCGAAANATDWFAPPALLPPTWAPPAEQLLPEAGMKERRRARRRAVRSGAAVEWGCCHALPTKYVDRYGFRRQLRDELAILERDAGWLRAEHPAARDAPVVRLADLVAASRRASRSRRSGGAPSRSSWWTRAARRRCPRCRPRRSSRAGSASRSARRPPRRRAASGCSSG